MQCSEKNEALTKPSRKSDPTLYRPIVWFHKRQFIVRARVRESSLIAEKLCHELTVGSTWVVLVLSHKVAHIGRCCMAAQMANGQVDAISEHQYGCNPRTITAVPGRWTRESLCKVRANSRTIGEDGDLALYRTFDLEYRRGTGALKRLRSRFAQRKA